MTLVELLHARLTGFVWPGDIAIDATAGNGHDTLALAELVGPTGRVFAFDIQPVALANTASRMAERGLGNVELWCRDHAEMREALPTEMRGRVAAVTFNLGFLPGGDKAITTHSETTLVALHAATEVLRPGGLLAVVAYRGHPGGQSEADAVAGAMAELREAGWSVEEIASPPGRKPGPILWLAVKPAKA